ncbi:MAG: glycosyltransferase family 87 protein [Candidatus Sulfotelmatobacter sp.]
MNRDFEFSSWITARRVRAHGFILALCLWSVYLWNISTPGLLDRAGNLKGADFLHLYTLGSLAIAHRGADLYNSAAQSQLAAQHLPVAEGIHYLALYPPQVSILFAPLARLSYPMALVCWLAFSSLVYAFCCYAIWRALPNLRQYKVTVFVLALGCPAFWHLIAWGQTSALALACFTLAFFALRARREFLAGIAFGCLIFKPQLGVAPAIIFLLTLRWRVIAGAFLSAVGELAAAWFYYGIGPLRQWICALLKTPHELSLLEPRIYQTHCLRTFWGMLIPWISMSLALYIISAVVVCFLSIVCWRVRGPLSLRFSTLLFATVLLAPHLTVYDLVILAPAFLLLCDWIAGHPEHLAAPYLKVLLYLAFVLPLVGPLARWTHFQPSVPVMFAISYEIWRIGGKSARVPESA